MDKNEKTVETTVFDYLRWRGDLTFAQDSFNEVDNLVLCIISYINFRRITAVHTLEPSAAPTLAEVAPLLTEEELADWFAIGQCTPGVIAVNTATFAGRKVLGNVGGVVATLGVVFPSLIIISLLAGVITTFAEVAWVKNAFAGIRVCVCVLIFNAVVKLWKKSVVDKKTLALYAVILLASLLTDLSPVIFVLFAAVSGIVLQVALKKGGEAE